MREVRSRGLIAVALALFIAVALLIPAVSPVISDIYDVVDDIDIAGGNAAGSPARVLSASTEAVTLKVDSPEGSLPAGANARITNLTSSELESVKTDAEALLGVQVVDAVAFDISFEKGLREIEPDGSVNVTVNYPEIADAASYRIIHFKDDGTVEEVPGTISRTSATFTANSFSVYAVVGTGVIVPRLTVTFMNGTTAIASMIVKAADTSAEVDRIIYDPGIGSATLGSNQVFKGWTTTQNYTKSSAFVSIAGVRTAAMEAAAALTADDSVTYYAGIFTTYSVSYFSNDDNPITVGTSVVEFPSYQESGEAEYTVNMGYTVDSGHNFQGWIPDEASAAKIVGYPAGAVAETEVSGNESYTVYYYPNGTKITVTGDISFTAKAPEGNWLIFDENGKGGKYNAPQFVLAGHTTSRPIPDSEMTRFGYSFDGWYYFPEGAVIPEPDSHKMRDLTNALEYEFGSTLAKNTTVYAKWKPNATAAYTVIFWTQDLTSIGAETLKYEVAGSYVNPNGTVGTNIPYTVVDNGAEGYVTGFGSDRGHYTGFGLTEASKNQQVKITPEGDAVLNLYYDRINYTFKFYLYRQSGNGNRPYTCADNSGTGSTLNDLVTWNAASGNHPSVSGYTMKSENHSFNNTNYTYHYFTISAFYGQDISGIWPTYDKIQGADGREAVSYVMMVGTKLKPAPTNQGSGTVKGIITVMNENILGATNEADGNYVIVRFPSSYYNWRYHIWFETVEGEDYTDKKTHTYNEKTYYEETVLTVRSSNTTDANQNEPKYTGFDYVTRLGQTNDGTVWSGGHWTTNEGGTTLYHLNYVYDRQQFKINYFDGQYVDGNNNGIQNRSGQMLHASDPMGQGVVIAESHAKYVPTLPQGEEGYVFEGWFIDEGCTAKYTWGHMPVGGITVYAKWRQIQYRVFLHTGLTGDDGTNLTWGTSNQALSFRIDYGKKVSAPTGIREGYKFLGWYTDPEFKNAFNADAVLLKEETVTAAYDKTTTPTDPEVRPWVGPWDLDEATLTALGLTTRNSDLTGWDHDGDDHGDENPEGFVPTPGIDRYWITKKLDLYAKWSKILEGAEGINVIYNAGDGSNAPSDHATYIENSNATAGAAATPPAPVTDENGDRTEYCFDHWVVCTWDAASGKYVYTDSSVKVFPGEAFAVTEKDSRIEELSNGQNKYTVQLLAVYKEVEKPVNVKIDWYSNFGTENGGKGTLYESDQGLRINEEINIYGLTFGENDAVTIVVPVRENFTFLGWTKTKGGTTADFLVWNGTAYKTAGTSGVSVTQVAADEKDPIEDLYAVWEELPKFYVYHSGVDGGNIETVHITDAMLAQDYAGYDLTANLTENTLYGGYYFEDGFTAPEAVIGETGGEALIPAYNGTNWIWTDPQTADGRKLIPEANVTYYIKEVPDIYLTPYTHIGYLGDVVKSLLIVTAVDDLTYNEAGFNYIIDDGEAVMAKAGSTFTGSLTVTTTIGDSKYVLSASDVNADITEKTGYVGYLHLTGNNIAPGKTISVNQWWETPDGVIVAGTVGRIISTGDGTTGDAGFSCVNK